PLRHRQAARHPHRPRCHPAPLPRSGCGASGALRRQRARAGPPPPRPSTRPNARPVVLARPSAEERERRRRPHPRPHATPRLRPPGPQHALDPLQEDVGLEVDAVARLALAERRLLERVRDERRREARAAAGGHRETHAVDGDRALLDQVGGQGAGTAEAVEEPVAVARDLLEASDAVDVALDDVAAHAVAHAERALEVDTRPGGHAAERGAAQRLGRNVDREAPVAPRGDGEAGAVHGDALAEREAREGPRSGDGETRSAAARPAPLDAAGRLDDAGEQLSRRPPAGRALVAGLALPLDLHERGAAGGAAPGGVLAPELLEQRVVALGEVALLLGLLLLVQLLAQAVFLA